VRPSDASRRDEEWIRPDERWIRECSTTGDAVLAPVAGVNARSLLSGQAVVPPTMLLSLPYDRSNALQRTTVTLIARPCPRLAWWRFPPSPFVRYEHLHQDRWTSNSRRRVPGPVSERHRADCLPPGRPMLRAGRRRIPRARECRAA